MFFKSKQFFLVLYIKTVDVFSFVDPKTDRGIGEKMNAGKQNGDEFPRNYVFPLEVWRWIVVWEVETDVNLSSLRILGKKF